MANWLNVLGGVGQGVTLGVQDLREMEKQKFLREQQEFLKQQQEQQRKEWAEQESLRQRVSQVRRTTPGYYGQPTNFPIRDDETGALMPGASETPRPAKEYYDELAAVYGGSADPRMAQLGLQYRTAATAAGEQDYANEQRNRLKEAQRRYQEMRASIMKDPAAASEQLLAQFNDNAIGGPQANNYFAAGMSTPNGPVINVYNRSQPGRPTMAIPVNPQALEQVARSMYFNELASIDPRYAELQLKSEELGIRGFGVRSEDAERQERIRTGNYGALGQNQAQASLLAEQLRTNNWGMLGRNQREGAAAGMSKEVQVGVDENGNAVYGYTVVTPDGKREFRRLDLPPGVRTTRPARDIDPEVKKAIVAGLEALPTETAARKNALAGMYERFGFDNVEYLRGAGRGGTDPTIAAALANPPGKPADKPAAKPDKAEDKPAARDDSPPANKDYEKLSPKAKAAGEALDKARMDVSKITVEGQNWGSTQRRDDPKGYEKYKTRKAEAEALYEAAKREWFNATGQ